MRLSEPFLNEQSLFQRNLHILSAAIFLTVSIFFLGLNLAWTPFPNHGNNSPSLYDHYLLATAVGVISVAIRKDEKLVEVVDSGTC